MKCPNCQTTLSISDRLGVEIDYCMQCRGVWLDRGELDKIIERSTADREAEEREERRDPWTGQKPYKGDHDDRYEHDRRYPKKKKGFLSELFDF